MLRVVVALILLSVASIASALKNVPPDSVTLDGQWTVNTAQSDNAERMLDQRMEEERREMRRLEERRKKRMQNDPFAWEPEYTPPERTPQNRAAMLERDRAMRMMIGATSFLTIAQTEGGAKIQITTEFDTRRFSAGGRSQVSMPQGQLADLETGWDRDVFVIDRRSKNGPRITERYRKLKTDQIESLITIRGDSMMSGMKFRRVFDRSTGAPPPPANPSVGPTR